MKCRNYSMKHVTRHAPTNLRFPLPFERGPRLALLELSDDLGLEARSLYVNGQKGLSSMGTNYRPDLWHQVDAPHSHGRSGAHLLLPELRHFRLLRRI